MGLGHSPRIVTDGLVLCLDAANKRSYGGSGTTWTDLTTNNYNGTLENNAAFNSANSGGIALDGADDRITIDDFEDLGDVFGNTADASFSCGVRLDNLGADGDIFVKGIHGGNTAMICWYDPSVSGGQQAGNTNTISFMSRDAGGQQMFISCPSNSVSVGEIFVVDVTIDASAGKVSIYKNAELLVSHTDSNYDGIKNDGTDYTLGADAYYYKDVQGTIYFFKAYNKCLSADEVRQNYLATKERYA